MEELFVNRHPGVTLPWWIHSPGTGLEPGRPRDFVLFLCCVCVAQLACCSNQMDLWTKVLVASLNRHYYHVLVWNLLFSTSMAKPCLLFWIHSILSYINRDSKDVIQCCQLSRLGASVRCDRTPSKLGIVLREFPSWLSGPRIQLGTMRLQVQSLASLRGLRIWCCRELWCRLQMWLGSCIAVDPCGCGVGWQL